MRSFAGCPGKLKVSTGGGKFPTWSRKTQELFFLGGDDRIMVASYTVSGSAISVGCQRTWSPPIRRDGIRQNFDISADGKRAVVFPAPPPENVGNLHATFIFNFFDEVRRRIP